MIRPTVVTLPPNLAAALDACAELAAIQPSTHDRMWRIAEGLVTAWRDVAMWGATVQARIDELNGRHPCDWLVMEAWWQFRAVRDAMDRRLLAQTEDARKAIGPALAAGADREGALRMARQRAVDALEADIAVLVDEECAWWVRWRHDRGFRAERGMAA